MSFPRYPRYKESGVDWLGPIPEHWAVDRFKRSIQGSKNGVWGDEARGDENDIPCVRVADFDRQRLVAELDDPTIRNITPSERVGRVLTRGDLLIEKSGGGDTQPVGCVVLYDDPRPAVCSNFVARVRVAPWMSPSYWRYAHASAYAVRINTRSIKQTSGIQNLDAQQYFDERVCFPSLAEQCDIASFLDRETAKIDALIAEQQRLMDLLQEKRQAVISHAVTKGLNPGAPMKPSGVEWLGDVPAHWELVKGARIGTLFGSEQVAEEQVVDDGTLPYIKVGSLSQDSFDVESWTWFVSPEVERHVTSRANYVVFPKRGAAIFTNKVNIVRVESLIDPNLMGWRINERARTDYVAFALKARGLTELADVSTVPQINNKHIAPQLFPLPPLSEQNAIVEHLTLEWSRIDALALDAKRAVDLLSERRAALISAAVTGQIDVRGFVEREAA